MSDDDPPPVLPLVSYDDDGKYRLHEGAVSVLNGLGKGRLAVVAVIGPYRSGKSFLLNKLSAQESREAGFAVGHKVESCTKGIWLRTKPVLLPADEQGERQPGGAVS